MKSVVCMMALALAALSSLALAKDKEKVEQVLQAQTTEEFTIQADGVRAQMQTGGRYEFVTNAERSTVEQRLNDMQKLLAEHGPASSMNDANRVALFNAQEAVNAILNQRDAKRLICERRAPTGSHVPQNNCRTYGEIERRRREAQREMTEYSQHNTQGVIGH